MDIADAQREVRAVYGGGFPGQLVSGIIWLVAAGTSVAVSYTAGIVTLLMGGALIFPLTTLLLRIGGGSAALPKGHPMAPLAMQIAFTVPLGLLVAVAAAGYREKWFFPASMVIVGAHYLPFTFLYGTALFTVLGGVLTLGGIALALWLPNTFATGGWVGGGLLLGFAFLLHASHRRTAGRLTRS
ncbi:MAG: hypothetical protein R6U94_05135 [Nitriliruptoraceae bacterium]